MTEPDDALTPDQPAGQPPTGVSPRWFVAIVGGILLLIGIIALAVPVNAERGIHSVECGSGFRGLSSKPGFADAGIAVGGAMYGDFTEPEETLEELCDDAIGSRRAWGWPVGGVGAAVLLGAAVVRNPSRAA